MCAATRAGFRRFRAAGADGLGEDGAAAGHCRPARGSARRRAACICSSVHSGSWETARLGRRCDRVPRSGSGSGGRVVCGSGARAAALVSCASGLGGLPLRAVRRTGVAACLRCHEAGIVGKGQPASRGRLSSCGTHTPRRPGQHTHRQPPARGARVRGAGPEASGTAGDSATVRVMHSCVRLMCNSGQQQRAGEGTTGQQSERRLTGSDGQMDRGRPSLTLCCTLAVSVRCCFTPRPHSGLSQASHNNISPYGSSTIRRSQIAGPPWPPSHPARRRAQ